MVTQTDNTKTPASKTDATDKGTDFGKLLNDVHMESGRVGEQVNASLMLKAKEIQTHADLVEALRGKVDNARKAVMPDVLSQKSAQRLELADRLFKKNQEQLNELIKSPEYKNADLLSTISKVAMGGSMLLGMPALTMIGGLLNRHAENAKKQVLQAWETSSKGFAQNLLKESSYGESILKSRRETMAEAKLQSMANAGMTPTPEMIGRVAAGYGLPEDLVNLMKTRQYVPEAKDERSSRFSTGEKEQAAAKLQTAVESTVKGTGDINTSSLIEDLKTSKNYEDFKAKVPALFESWKASGADVDKVANKIVARDEPISTVEAQMKSENLRDIQRTPFVDTAMSIMGMDVQNDPSILFEHGHISEHEKDKYLVLRSVDDDKPLVEQINQVGKTLIDDGEWEKADDGRWHFKYATKMPVKIPSMPMYPSTHYILRKRTNWIDLFDKSWSSKPRGKDVLYDALDKHLSIRARKYLKEVAEALHSGG